MPILRWLAIACILIKPATLIGQDHLEPAKHATFDAEAEFELMQDAFNNAETLSYVSSFDVEVLGVARSSCRYRVWLKKPNLMRMEVESDDGQRGGVLIGDGADLWIHWPEGRPRFELIREVDLPKPARKTSFMKKEGSDASRVSIAHEAPLLGYGMGFPILDPSMFHGHQDSLSSKIDSYRPLGYEQLDHQMCRKVELSILDRQRSQYLWISESDHIPRRQVEIVRLEHDVVTRESWSDVRVNEPIPDHRFQWSPPPGWTQWRLPDDEDHWPNIGSEAPDFSLKSIDGPPVSLSQFRGKVVWLNFWRVGCPPCIEELPFLQKMHEQYSSQGMVLIGINVSDDRKVLRKALTKMQVTYLNVLDTSPKAEDIYFSKYGVGAIPMNCLIDADGVTVDTWSGYSEERTKRALRRAGLAVE